MMTRHATCTYFAANSFLTVASPLVAPATSTSSMVLTIHRQKDGKVVGHLKVVGWGCTGQPYNILPCGTCPSMYRDFVILQGLDRELRYKYAIKPAKTVPQKYQKIALLGYNISDKDTIGTLAERYGRAISEDGIAKAVEDLKPGVLSAGAGEGHVHWDANSLMRASGKPLTLLHSVSTLDGVAGAPIFDQWGNWIGQFDH
jgi:hypothetical protein